MTLGSLMIDLEGPSLSQTEKNLLQHPLVGGVIFFARHYQTPEQMQTLVADIRAIRPSLLLAVDKGAVFSDDLSMAAAKAVGNPTQRVRLALEAGCDMVLLCNDRAAVLDVLETFEWEQDDVTQSRLVSMRAKKAVETWDALRHSDTWQTVVAAVTQYIQ